MLKKCAFIPMIIVFVAGAGHATQPMDALKCDIDRITAAVRGADDGVEDRRGDIALVMEEMFDFSHIARIVVARHWERFDNHQRAAFTEVVSRLLGERYVRKMEKFCKKEKVLYLEQEFSGDRRVEVKTRLLMGFKDIPVDYRMRFNGERWKVYDIRVAGVSVLRSYGRQFHSFLKREPPGKLIRRLRKKVDGGRY